MTFDPAAVALGKKAGVVEDPRTFHLRTLLDPAAVPSVPGNWRYAHTLREVPMFANDRYGCCTCASNGHRIVAQEFATRQREIALGDADVLEVYRAVTGFDPYLPGTDNGAYMLDVANYMRRVGMGRERDGSRHMVDAFVKVDHDRPAEVKTACNLFGGVWLGVALPLSAQAQTDPDLVWDAPDHGSLTGPYEPGSWGGHAVQAVGYNARGVQIFTWGREQFMSWRFWLAYVDEAYALVDEDWFRKGGTSPRGFNADQLRSWLADLR